MFPRRFLAKRMTANVAPSLHMRDRAALPRTQVIYHGVAPFDAVPVPSASRANGPACFAFVGRLVKEKGVVTLFQAAHLLRQNGHQFRLTIVGDGPERLALEKLAAELGLADQTEFTGPVPAASIASALGEAAAIVMPSIWEDVAPLVALEQMMQGRLLIVSDIGGLGETVNGFGLKFPAGDAAALASCMEQVIECPNLAAEMGKKAHLHALKAYTLERMVDEHVCLYHELTRHPRN